MPGFGFDEQGAKIDPRLRDGLYLGPSRGHVDADRATKIGMPRAYGYGATMGAWVTDHVAHWAGHEGFVRYSNTAFRGPAYEGDITSETSVLSRSCHRWFFASPRELRNAASR